MDLDNNVVIAGMTGYKGAKWQWKKYNEKKILDAITILQKV